MANFNSCPNCGNRDNGKQRGTAQPYVSECKKCAQVMCPKCGDHSFWSGAQCPSCGSTNTRDIGRITG